MKIVYRENMLCVFDRKELEKGVHWIIKHFIKNMDEVLYFVESGILRAVVSTKDILMFLEGEKKEVLNYDFTAVLEKDLEQAQIFMNTHPTIHEVPIINTSGKLIGVFQSENENSKRMWHELHSMMKGRYYNLPLYYQKLSEKFMNYFKGTLLLFDLPKDSKVIEKLQNNSERNKFALKHMTSALELLNTMTSHEEKLYWGETYKAGISKKFVKEFTELKVSEKNGIKYYENSEYTNYISFENGKRKVINANRKAKQKIYLVGPCTVFGAYVADNQTIEYYLQEFLDKEGYSFEVVNFGALGLYFEFQYLLTEPLRNEDIVIIASQNKKLIKNMSEYGNAHYLGDCSDIYDTICDPLSCVLDTFRHVNYRVSKAIAKQIYCSIKAYLPKKTKEENKTFQIQDYFISWDIVAYYKDFALNYNLDNLNGNVGAIVMNCNPFTKGHKYLIEYAASKVDELIIFVVEEDASDFSYEERIEMVRAGTEDVHNINVVPSGKYNISKSTFAQYFEKDKPFEQIESMEYDLRIFCEVIAECMNISCRFAGEEPTDLVTRQYNEAMRNILPQYHIEFIEIPRLKVQNKNEYISASRVREYLKKEDWGAVSELLPESSLKNLRKKY